MRTVLVIDDNPGVPSALEVLFGLHEIRTVSAGSPEQGLSLLESSDIDLVIADMNFRADTTSGEEGTRLFRDIRAGHPDLPVILLTAWTHLEAAVELVKAGAADYLAKPWDNRKLLATVENLLELAQSTRDNERLRRERRRRKESLANQYDLRGTVVHSEPMMAAVELACRVARAPAPVLVTGPSGAGKERIAEIIHANSASRRGPLVIVNCGALPPELLEAELFGVEAGAYTGAQRARAGRFELAEGGTLFLDEIGNLPSSGQMKLLRVLETGRYEALGSSRTREAHVRIVSATNADLRAMIATGTFREDLYYRLNVIEIALPPLFERPDDILPLAQRFLGDDARLSEEAGVAMMHYDWPGNVRELRNCIERAKLLAEDHVIRLAHLNLPAAASRVKAAGRSLDDPSREVIEAALRETGGNVTRAAVALGLSRQALYRRIERFGMRAATDE
ncbi:MAG TPA: sigma-54 dependent transcriptional regulator [Steroidobacteraceae bacterium]|nr:sigma-54 dependent transcriptional regulator [Steroidobacteraceae bacterium]